MRRGLLVCGAVLAVGALAACSGSSGAASSDAVSGAASSAATGGAAGGRVASAGQVAAPRAAGGSADAAKVAGSTTLTDGARIRTAELSVDITGSKNVTHKADRADAIVEGAGGFVDSDQRSLGTDASAELHFRVPPEQLVRLLASLSALGTEVSRTGSSRDVTTQVADVSSRVLSAEQAIARLRTLYSHAVKVGDVIAVEDELSQRESDLESLQAQQRSLSRQTQLAAVTLSLQTASAATHRPATAHGFLGGLSRGWHAFVTAATAVVTGLGAGLPFVLLLVLLVVALRLLWPRLGRRATPVASGGPSPAE